MKHLKECWHVCSSAIFFVQGTHFHILKPLSHCPSLMPLLRLIREKTTIKTFNQLSLDICWFYFFFRFYYFDYFCDFILWNVLKGKRRIRILCELNKLNYTGKVFVFSKNLLDLWESIFCWIILIFRIY